MILKDKLQVPKAYLSPGSTPRLKSNPRPFMNIINPICNREHATYLTEYVPIVCIIKDGKPCNCIHII